MVVPQLDRTAFCGCLPIRVILRNLSGIALKGLPGGPVQMVIQTTLDFSVGRGNGKANPPCNRSVRSAGIEKFFDIKAVCPGYAEMFFHHQNPFRFLKVRQDTAKHQGITLVLTFDSAELAGG
jgi:hypothetical protein